MHSRPHTTQSYYDIILRRDKRYDERFFFAVKTTGIYCRPSCPAARPLARNVIFYQTGEEAHAAGFRACKRCRPDEPVDHIASQAVRLLQNEPERRIEDVAKSFSLTSRHLRRTVKAATGLTPSEIRLKLRLDRAAQLLRQTDLSVTDIAFAAEFTSIRQFNHAFKAAFAMSPQEFRRAEKEKQA